MVAEFHRILTRGGVFLYPVDAENSAVGGKLRLMYEAIPMAKLAEVAGGSASDGLKSILDLTPVTPHQRVSVVLEYRDELTRVAACFDTATQ
jgi:fructose-1,6-bisphosphatase I